MSSPIQTGSLVLYKIRPARVRAVSDKIDIELEGGKSKRVRDKDIALLHPGPLTDLGALKPLDANLQDAWELVAGEQVSFAELAELLFDDYTPASAWATWELIADGLYFEGDHQQVRGREPDVVEQELAARNEKQRQAEAWDQLLEHIRSARLDDDDRKQLSEVERVALGTLESSRIMQALGIKQGPEHAHRLLLRCGYWTAEHNPWPGRAGLPLASPRIDVPALADEPRADLTALAAFAIDDEGSNDPDDALSIDGDRLWVHVADVAALVAPDSELDREARSRGANLYLPEVIVHMLPEPLTHQLGLGLNALSPALSIGFRQDDDGKPCDVQIQPSTLRVQRLSYAEANERMADEPFAAMRAFTERFAQWRDSNGAATLDLPEVSVRLRDGEIVIRPLQRLDSRQMVTEAMLMAGAAVAEYAQQHDIAMPYATQPPPDSIQQPDSMAGMYAYRRLFKPSRAKTEPEPHFGLGLPMYCRSTSPLRRYADLLVHQQLRAHLRGQPTLDAEQVASRVGEAEVAGGLIRRTERQSNQHWKLAWLKRHADWQGEAVVVELGERKHTLMIPELALETRQRVADVGLDQVVRLCVTEVDLADQSARFRVLD